MESFNPQVYNFGLSAEFADAVLNWELNAYQVDCPRYQVLLDHTLAVVWHLFNDNGSELINLNKADIAWALKFLEAIDTNECEPSDTKDLVAIMRFMRKLLITRYSMEDEAQIPLDNQTFHESLRHDTSSSFALDEFLEQPDVGADRNKPMPVEKHESLQLHDGDETKCTAAEILKCLKQFQGGTSGTEMSISDVIEKLEK